MRCAAPLPQGLAIQQATREDLELLKPFEERRSQETLSRWLSRGYILVLAKQTDGRVVAFHCISHEHPYPVLLRRAVPLRAAEVWLAETYLLPEWRGNGLYEHLKGAADRLAQARGFTRAVGTVQVQNLASRKANARIGSREIGRLWFFSTRWGRGCLVWRNAVDGRPGCLGVVTTHRSWMLSTR